MDSTDSSTQGDASEGAVEAMLEPSTVILSQDPADSVPAPTATDLDQIPDLQYPISDPPDHMDVDAEVSTKAMDVDTYIYSKDMDIDNASTRASIGQSSRSASSALSESGDVRILPTMSDVRDDAIDVDDVNVKSSTVPVALFYGTSSKGKGKDKAVLGLAGESDSGLQDEEQETEDTMSSPIERYVALSVCIRPQAHKPSAHTSSPSILWEGNTPARSMRSKNISNSRQRIRRAWIFR